MSEQDQDFDTITSNEDTQDLDNTFEDTEDVDALREELERERTARQQLTARAKKAEAELKTMKSQPVKATQHTNNLTSEEIEAKILKAQNVTEEEIAYLKKLAAFNGVSLLDAQSDDMFVSFKAKRDQELKSEKAKLGVSSRSGQYKQEKTFNTPGLSDADHKAKWLESQR